MFYTVDTHVQHVFQAYKNKELILPSIKKYPGRPSSAFQHLSRLTLYNFNDFQSCNGLALYFLMNYIKTSNADK